MDRDALRKQLRDKIKTKQEKRTNTTVKKPKTDNRHNDSDIPQNTNVAADALKTEILGTPGLSAHVMQEIMNADFSDPYIVKQFTEACINRAEYLEEQKKSKKVDETENVTKSLENKLEPATVIQ
jgi:hypothetical protein